MEGISSKKDKVFLDIIIPTLGTREILHDVIDMLAKYTGERSDINVRVTVSFNPKTQTSRTVYLKRDFSDHPNFSVNEISPPSYESTTEHHLLWCLRWYKENTDRGDAYLWPLTDYDPIIQSGFDAVIEFLKSHEPDAFFVNNVWGDVQGEFLPSPAFRANQLIWKGSASFFFRSLGYEHATSTVGTFFLRSSFIDDEVLRMYDATMQRSVVCAQAWWMFEAGMYAKNFYFVATPIVVNKFNPHHFDTSPTWREHASREKVQSKFSWTIGYMRHLEYYVQEGKLTYKEIRTSILSEPQRGVLLFLDEILRQLFEQAKLALRSPWERFDQTDVDLIKRLWNNVYPLRMPMINLLCDVLDARNEDIKLRLRSYKLAIQFRAIEEEQGIYFPVFRNAYNGYYCLEHNVGFVGVLDKRHIYKAYRDLDPFDISPFILYAETEEELLEKICAARETAKPEAILFNFDYWTVNLRPPFNPTLRFPSLQIYILSQSNEFIYSFKKSIKPVMKTVRFFRKIASATKRIISI